MKISTEQQIPGKWVAVDDDTYDGPGSPIGTGNTEKEAIHDLCTQLLDRWAEEQNRKAGMFTGRVYIRKDVDPLKFAMARQASFERYCAGGDE